MTLAFTFPIKDAWVIVSDKGVISRLDTKNELFKKITTFSDCKIKIKSINDDLFFVGAGEDEYLDKIVKILNEKNFDDLKNHFAIEFGEVYGGIESTVSKDEEFLIVKKSSQKAFKIDVRLLNKDDPKKGVFELDIRNLENNFIGSFKNNCNLSYVKNKIPSIRDLLFEDVDESLYNICNDLLSLLSTDYPNLVGHPSIQGSNIWIISKDNVKKVFTFPKNNYDYKVR